MQKEYASRSKHPGFWLAVFAWGLLALSGHALIFYFNKEETLHTLRMWEQRLVLIAHHQANQIGTLVGEKKNTLKSIAENVSVQLYLTAILHPDSGADMSEAELTFLRNYVFALAQQSGLSAAESDAAAIPANVAMVADAGLAIVTSTGEPVVSTRHFPPLGALQAVLMQGKDGQTLLGPPASEGRVWLSIPIYPVQAEAEDAPLGWAIATFQALPKLNAILAEGELPDTPATSLLVGMQDGAVRILAPASARGQTLQSSQFVALAAQAHEKHQTLLTGRNEKGDPAFAFGQEVTGAGWTVVREVSRAAALKENAHRTRTVLAAYWLAVIAVTFVTLALWKYVTENRLKQLLQQISRHEKLLKLVAEHIPARLFIADAANRIIYANIHAAQKAGMDPADMTDKTFPQVFGVAEARPYQEASERVLSRNTRETVLREHSNDAGLEFAFEIAHIPLASLPHSVMDEPQKGVLVIEQDLTEIMRAKYERQRALDMLVDTIVALVDMRDPHAARHSAGVAMMAHAIAETMQLDREVVEAVAVAGRLMNLGKLFIPEHVLAGNQTLPDGEKREFAKHMRLAADHLSKVPFEGPVLETLRQAQEKPDGTGPLGLRDGEILTTAQILSVANSFVALVSSRSYRKQCSLTEAMTILRKGSSTAYAPAVLTALAHYLDNLGGAARWEAFSAGE